MKESLESRVCRTLPGYLMKIAGPVHLSVMAGLFGFCSAAMSDETPLVLDPSVVTGSRSANFLDSSGTSPGGTVLLYLNCNNSFAAAGVPGNSIGSPEGRQARQDYEDKLAEAQAEAEQNQQDELLQSNTAAGG